MIVGEQIKALRVKRGMTQEDLAANAGLSSKRVIWDYESGRRTPHLRTLEKIASALDCKLEIFLKPIKNK